MRRIKSIIALVLASVLLISIAGCGGTTPVTPAPTTVAEPTTVAAETTEAGETTEAATGPEELTLPLTTTNEKLMIFIGMADSARQYQQSMLDNPVTQEMIKETGLDLQFMHPPAGDNGEFFNLTIASGDYPDLFMVHDGFSLYPGGPDGAMKDGVLINMNELIEKYAPNYLQLVADYKAERNVTSDEGNIIRFGTIFTPPVLLGKVGVGSILRRDLMEEAGITLPQTIDEFTALLHAYKDMGVKIPLLTSKYQHNWWTNTSSLATAFGVTHRGFFLDQGNVVYSPMQPGYKQYLTQLNYYYANELMDPDFATTEFQDSVKTFTAGDGGVIIGHMVNVKTFMQLGTEKNPEFDIQAVPFFTPDGKPTNLIQPAGGSFGGRSWFVSTTAKDPVLAVKFVDYLHMPETMTLAAWGPGSAEFPTWEMVDGKRKLTKWMNEKENHLGVDYTTARALWTANNLQVMWDNEMETQQYDHPRTLELWEIYGKTVGEPTGVINANVSMTGDESKEFTKIMSQVNTYAEEMFHKFVMGSEPLENFDKYVQTIKDMGVDEAIEIQQGAYKRYLAR